MDLRDLLASVPRDVLDRYAANWPVASGPRIPALAAAMREPEAIAARIAALPPAAARLLARLVAARGALPERAAPRAAAAALAEIPLAFRTRGPSGGRTLYLPDDLLEAVETALLRLDAEAVGRREPVARRTASGSPDRFVRLAVFLAEEARLRGLPRTKEGRLSRREADRLARRFDPSGATGENDLLAAAAFAEAVGLLAAGRSPLAAGGGSYACGPAFEALRAAPIAEWARLLLLWAASDPARGFHRWHLFHLAAEAEATGRFGIEIEAAVDRLAGGSAPLRRTFAAALDDLVAFGLLEAAEGAAFRSVLGRALSGGPAERARTFRVLPNGELLVPRDLAPDLLARLAVWAERRKVDVVESWALTRESVGRAALRGGRMEELLALLSECGGGKDGAVPEELTTVLSEWVEGTRRFLFHDGPVLVLADPADADWTRARLAEKGLLAGEAGPAFFLRPASREAVAEVLGAPVAGAAGPSARGEGGAAGTGGPPDALLRRTIARLEAERKRRVTERGFHRPVFEKSP